MKHITNATLAYELIAPLIQDEEHETLVCVTLGKDKTPRSIHIIASGDDTHTEFEPKTIYQLALLNQASGIILAHNHPSGDARPSIADIKATEKVCKALQVMEIPLMDHIIIGKDSYYSFAYESKI